MGDSPVVPCLPEYRLRVGRLSLLRTREERLSGQAIDERGPENIDLQSAPNIAKFTP